MRKKLHGLFQPDSDIVVGYLIGQLAKNDSYRDNIAGSLLVQFALKMITSAKQQVGGHFVIVECARQQKLLEFYQTNGFDLLPYETDEDLVQLVRKLE